MQEPFIKIPRRILESPEWQNGQFDRGKAEVDLLGLSRFTACHIHVRGIRVDLQPGQLAIGEVELALRWGWSRGKIRRFLNDLQMSGVIEQQKNRLISIITIKSQSKNTTNDTTGDTTNELQMEQQVGQLLHIGEKEERKMKKGKAAPRGGADLFDGYSDEVKKLHKIFCELQDVKPSNDNTALRAWLETWKAMLRDGLSLERLEAGIKYVGGHILQTKSKDEFPGWHFVIRSPQKFRAKWDSFKDRIPSTSKDRAGKCPRGRYCYSELKSRNGSLPEAIDPDDIIDLPDQYDAADIPDEKKFCTNGEPSGWNPTGRYERFELFVIGRFPDGMVEVCPLQERCPHCNPEAAVHV